MPPKTKKVKNEKQVLWTLQERFAVWHLLHDNKFALNDQGWRTIWQEIAIVDRDLQTVWDDYTQRNAPSRGAMYRKSIEKRNYTPEEATAYANACAEVHRAAKKHGIKLRARPYKASSRKDKKKDDGDNDDNDQDDDDDKQANEEEPKVKVATSSRAKPKPQTTKQKSETIKPTPQTTKQKPGRKRKDQKPKDTPREKTPAVVKRVAQKQPRNRPEDRSKKEELGHQHDLLSETNTDIKKHGLLPPNDPAAARVLEEAARLSRSQFVSSKLVADGAVTRTGMTPQKRKLQGSDLAPTAGNGQDGQGDVEMSGVDEEQQNVSSDTGTNDEHDEQHLVKKARSIRSQNDAGNNSLLKAALQGAHRQRSQTPASGQQNSVEQVASPTSPNRSVVGNDVEMTSPEEEQPAKPTATAIRHYKVPAADQATAFDNWWQDELNRILLGPAYDLFPKKEASVTEEYEELDFPLYPAQRIAAFFLDMYNGQLLGDGFTQRVEELLVKEDITNLILIINRDLSINMSIRGISPKYELEDVFTSPLSPFSNFRLASAVFGEGLQMLHKKDIDYSGPANQQLVACAKLGDRHPTPEDYQFVDPNEPAFKRGGRVHKLYVRQQECHILGDNKRWNTAYVCMDVMLCQQEDCEKCSGYGGAPLQTATSLPRVHMRHTAGKIGEEKTTGVFDEPEVKINARYNKDEDGKFVVNLAYGVVPMEFWDGTIQDVVLCDQDSCQGCREAHGALPFPKKE